MRRVLPFPSLATLPAVCLLFLGSAPVVQAEGPSSPFEHLVASWMGVVGVIGSDGEGDVAEGFEIDDEAAEDAAAEEREADARRHRARRGRGHERHGDRRDGPPPRPHGMMGHSPHHGGPDMHHHAMRAFQEIIRRLARIEEKLGIEDAPPSGPRGDRPRPEMRGPQRGGERVRERREIPEDVRRQMAERMEAGRRQMAEARERMENAKRRMREMEERIERLEAEVSRLKGAK